MAEGNEKDENSYPFDNYSRKKEQKPSDVENENEEKDSITLDLGIGNQHKLERRNVNDNFSEEYFSTPTVSGSSETPKREENPFSFKHFLRDTGNSYHNTGARPKVFKTPTTEQFNKVSPNSPDIETSLHDRTSTPRHVGTPELTSVLPDFVQDHLVVEQCYLSHSDSFTPPQVDLENLPDFTINNISLHSSSSSNTGRRLRSWDETNNLASADLPKDIPCDLTGTTEHTFSRLGPTPLDLPNCNRNSVEVQGRHVHNLPFDLPLVNDNGEETTASSSGMRNDSQHSEVGTSKSLPDFLSDGPIHSGRHGVDVTSETLIADVTRNSLQCSQVPEAHIQRIQLEKERLERMLEMARNEITIQSLRIEELEKILSLQYQRSGEVESIERAKEQAEDNIRRTTRRAVIAENTVTQLRQEIKSLQTEISHLKQENHELRYGQGASAATGSSVVVSELRAQRVAQELRSAAGSAETSLRQLLAGVHNLRIIASTVENMHRVHDRADEYLSDIDDDAGPAL